MIGMILLLVCLITSLHNEASSIQTFRYEKMHNYGLGRRVIPNFRRNLNYYGYPEVLFKKKPKLYIRPPYRNVYQGVRRKGDRRVYNQNFTHRAEASAIRMFTDAVLNCVITHMAVETTENMPVIYRGGAGYRFFMVIIKSEPGVEISGRVRAYCKNYTDEQF